MFSDKRPKIGVIGLGIIGSRVAHNLRAADAHVYVWSRTPKPEPNFLSSPVEVAHLADAIQIFVRRGADLLEVVDAMAPKLGKRHVVLNHATVEPEATAEAAQRVADRGASFVDCPFTGSKVAAEKAALVYYAGGDTAVVDRVRPILALSGKEVLHLGDVGDATLLKIATNMITSTTVEVLSEAYALIESQGIDPGKLGEALEHNACGSVVAQMKLPSIIARDYTPHFSLANMHKDAGFALQVAAAKGIDLPALATTEKLMGRLLEAGHGEEDFSILASRYQDADEAGEAKAPTAAPAPDADPAPDPA